MPKSPDREYLKALPFFCAKCKNSAEIIDFREDQNADRYLYNISCHGKSELVELSGHYLRRLIRDPDEIIFGEEISQLTVFKKEKPVTFPNNFTFEDMQQLIEIFKAADQAKIDRKKALSQPQGQLVAPDAKWSPAAKNQTDWSALLGSGGSLLSASLFGSGAVGVGGAGLIPVLHQEAIINATPPTLPPLQVITLAGQEMNIVDFQHNLQRCRSLVNGLKVERILIEPETTKALFGLLKSEHPQHLGENGFAQKDTFGGQLHGWRGISIYAADPHNFINFTLDISGVPFIYRNESGINMQIQPPWISEIVGRRPVSEKEIIEPKKSERKILLIPKEKESDDSN